MASRPSECGGRRGASDFRALSRQLGIASLPGTARGLNWARGHRLGLSILLLRTRLSLALGRAGIHAGYGRIYDAFLLWKVHEHV